MSIRRCYSHILKLINLFFSLILSAIPFGLYKHVKEELPQYLIDSRVGFLLARIIGNAFDSIGMHYGVNLTEKAKKLYKEFARETKDMILDINPIDFDGKILFFNVRKCYFFLIRSEDRNFFQIQIYILYKIFTV